jgi:hypothetical protein
MATASGTAAVLAPRSLSGDVGSPDRAASWSVLTRIAARLLCRREDGRVCCGLLQVGDKSGDREVDESDETKIRELAASTGEKLDALRLAADARRL